MRSQIKPRHKPWGLGLRLGAQALDARASQSFAHVDDRTPLGEAGPVTPDPAAKGNGNRHAPASTLRVLVVTNLWPTPANPGLGVFVRRELESLAKLGVNFDVYFINGTSSKWAYLRAALKMLALNFQKRDFDLIHAYAGHSALVASLQWRYPILASYLGYEVHGETLPDDRMTVKTRLEAIVFRHLTHRLARTITMSERMDATLPARVRRRSEIVPTAGIDRGSFFPLERTAARRKLGWSQEEIVVMFSGDPDLPEKRFFLAEEVCRRVGPAVQNLSLRTCWGVHPDEVPLWMNAADVLLVTSAGEGSPNVVKEAMACNLPIVSVDVGDVAAVVAGTDRCEVTSSDPVALAAALARILAGVPARTDGRKRSEGLALERVAERLLSIYEQVAARRPTTRPSIPGIDRGQP